MEKTYYKKLRIHPRRNGHGWLAQFEFSDEPDGFFMPMVLEGDTEQEVTDKFNHFIGEECEMLDAGKVTI